MKKRRSDISKLVTASRDIWRQSEIYHIVKRRSRDPNRTGWFKCSNCNESREVIRVDHISPIGKQPKCLLGFGEWLEKLFCPETNLSGICVDCHKKKTKSERKKIKLITGSA